MHLPGVLDDIAWRLLCTLGLFLVTLFFKAGTYIISHEWSNLKGYFDLRSRESRSIPGLVLDIKCTIPWIYNIYRNSKVELYLSQHYNNAVSYYPALFKAKCLIAIQYIVWLLLLTQWITTGSNAMSIQAGGTKLVTGMNPLRTDRAFHEDDFCKSTVNIGPGISSGSHCRNKRFDPCFLSYSTPPVFTGPVCILNSILHKDALEPLYSLGDPSSQGYTGDDLYNTTTDVVSTNLSETTHSIGIPQSKLKPKPIPFNVDAPLENQPLPPWAYEFVTGVSDPKEEYVPRHYTEQEIQEHFRKVNEETRKRAVTTRLDETTGEPPKSYGFKFKQIQPLRHHNGKSFTFYYIHSLHTNVIPVLLNSLRRVAKRHLGAGRITALRIPGMKNEFYSIVGLREDFFDLSRNLTKVIFRNVPMTATFHRPLIGRLRLKGPIIAVAGHIELDQTFQKEGVGSSSGSKDDRGIEIVNKNQYICALSRDAYLDMEVKIEYIANYVMPEKGPESLNRDITPDGFIHFSSSCTPIEVFAFDGDRRGIDEESTSEIVTLELHTDGSTTPRLALLNCATFIETWFERTYKAFRRDCTRDLDALHEEMASVSTAERLSPELYRNSPYNPYRKPEDKMPAKYSWFYRHDVKRQYPIDPDSRLAKREQLEEWNRHVDDEIAKMENTLPYQPDDRTVKPDRYLSFEETAEKAGFNSPMWIFHDPLGKGMLSNSPVFEFDKEDDPMSFPIE